MSDIISENLHDKMQYSLSYTPVFPNPGPQGPCMFSMFPWFKWMGQVFKLCRTTHSLESGVLEQGNMENMQAGVPSGPGLRNTALDQ